MVYEDRKLDYTNLKIDTLKIDGDSDPDAEEEETNEDGEKVKKSKEGGPWSKLVASDSVEIPPEPEKKTPGINLNICQKARASPMVGGKYGYIFSGAILPKILGLTLLTNMVLKKNYKEK